jgi:hypothetical protein
MAGSIPDMLAEASARITRDADGGARDPANGDASVAGPRYDPRRYVLILRFALANLVGFALLGVAWVNGFVDLIRAGDDTHQCDLIFGVFLAGLVMCAARIFQASRELNAAREFDPAAPSEASRYVAKLAQCSPEGRGIVAGTLRLRLSHRIAAVRHIGSTLVLLGLLGTVVGFIIALSGVDPQKATEVSAISPMVSTLIRGMSTALYTTLVGCILNIWLMVNYRLLATGTVKLVTTITELGERHGRV